jgi:hypothetical protein
MKIGLLELLACLESLLKDRVREKIANLQAHQGLTATGSRRIHFRFQARVRNVVQFEQGSAFDVDRID